MPGTSGRSARTRAAMLDTSSMLNDASRPGRSRVRDTCRRAHVLGHCSARAIFRVSATMVSNACAPGGWIRRPELGPRIAWNKSRIIRAHHGHEAAGKGGDAAHLAVGVERVASKGHE